MVRESEEPPALGTAGANFHLLAFSWKNDVIWLDFFHGLCDAAGMFPLLRTVLYYYCRLRYDDSLSSEGVRLKGDPILEEEVAEPYPEAVDASSIQPIGKTK